MLGTWQQFWVDELRSGQYKQTNTLMCEIVKGEYYYDPLGVLYECLMSYRDELPFKIAAEQSKNKVFYDGDEHIVSKDVQKFMGLKSQSGRIAGYVGRELLSGNLVVISEDDLYCHSSFCVANLGLDFNLSLPEVGDFIEKYASIIFDKSV